MRRLRALEASAIALACWAATACSGSNGAAPTPSTTIPATTSPAPSAGTGSGGTTPPPSTLATSSTSDPAQDPLYLEAVGVYKKYFAEMQKFEAAQYPTRTLPTSMNAYMTSAVRADITAAVNASQDAGEVPRKGESSVLAVVQPNPGAHWEGSTTSVSVCVDSRAVEIVRPKSGTPVKPGVLAYKQIYFSRRGPDLVMSYIDAKVVEWCPIAGP